MAQWDNYSQKSTPADTDTLMLKDNAATGKPNKRLLFSGLWTWIVDKLTNAVINNLQTTTKTVVGGMNNLQEAVSALNSKQVRYALINSSTTFNIPNGYRGLIFIVDSTSYRNGMWFLHSTETGSIGTKEVSSSSSISFATATNKLTVNVSDGSPSIVFITFSSTAPTKAS